MLQHLRTFREKGFTLVELLVVIVVIGILAAIAIPVFVSQRGHAHDTRVKSDLKNAATAAESFLADRTKSVADLSKAAIEYTASAGVSWDIKGNTATGGYCIAAIHPSSKTYTSTPLTYDSTAGGLGRNSGSCAGNGNTPTVSTSGSSEPAVSAPAVNFIASGTGATGATQTFTVSATGTYRIEAWGAQGGDGTLSTNPGNRIGAPGAYASGTVFLNAGQVVSIRVGHEGVNGANSGGGGGGTYVVGPGAVPLVIAGGGGGGNHDSSGDVTFAPTPGNTGTNGMDVLYDMRGGTDGSGAAPAPSPDDFPDAGGGGGLNTSAPSYVVGGGASYLAGSAGGGLGGGCYGGAGGFGGGGSGGCGDGGGGGGYSGGAAGFVNVGGGGGGSFVATSFNATAVSNSETNNTSKANFGHGKVRISQVS